ncbi:uncharacterized protein PV09_01055 [Verruconis gallopava]|uniref:DUF1765-domain-containing protein n=1 Tax=Verruconis gallopava TaxID=253628 RepID=A0A0D2ANM7_9PEZI|nr:uncharacterized protein PV09_01055 [Verruconis gallopava]KIW08120.1 hypothetical protein PV09_01055 [Verruconis gallopava]
MAAAAVDTFTMALEFHESKEGSLFDAVFGETAVFDNPDVPTTTTSSREGLPRAASYNDFSTAVLHEAQSDSASNDDVRDSSSIDDTKADGVTSASSGETTPESEAAPSSNTNASHKNGKSPAMERRMELPKLDTADNVINRSPAGEYAMTAPILRTPASAESDEVHELPSQSSNHLTARFRRRSWMPGSRSPSPGSKKSTAEGLVDTLGKASSVVRRSSPFRRSTDSDNGDGRSRSRSSSLSRSITSKLSKRPNSAVFESPTKGSSSPVNKPSQPSQLSKSFSTDKLSLSSFTKKSSGSTPPVPRLTSKDKQRLANSEVTKKRDELWTVFRNLEGDFQKFQSKPTTLKANVVRASLIPFLREYQHHQSTYNLRFEDLERRANILHKWWSGLLELILNKNNQSVSGTDRPVVFDGILGIMERPEWRLAPSPYAPLWDRQQAAKGHQKSTSVTSTSSESSDVMLGDSVVHNVRNLFQQNLIDQMGYVVEKMAMRNAPASSVSFCGRTCAYAFFFCPGIADVLVRLWNPTMDSLNRVLQECGHKRSISLKDTAERIGQGFPSHLKSLRFHNISAIYKALRKPAPLPLRTHTLPWSSHPWVSRWCGKDSDLFYVFAKHYHMLVVDFLPADTTRTERLCAPGLIFVHAQILMNMDATIHRNVMPNPMDPGNSNGSTANSTFDDILGDPDSAAPPFPLPPAANAVRQMSENRLIMLVRDLLSERNTNPEEVRIIFGMAFADLLKAAARRTSIYDPSACYVLCDLLEEAFLILVRYEQLNPVIGSVLDWSFWMDVWRRIVESHNTTTEIRLYALLYSLWPAFVIEPQRRAELCASFLLEPKFFASRFNHWCPMVRAYYQRLLCWRVARFDGEEQPGDVEILSRLSENLQTQYGYYLYMRDAAQGSPTLLPSTAPCNPAPGRRLLIVRTDHLAEKSRGAFMSFDGVLTPHPASKRQSMLADLSDSEPRPVSNDSTDSEPELEERGPRKWGLLRTIIGTSKQETAKAGQASQDTKEKNSAPQPQLVKRPSDGSDESQEDRSSFRPFTFKFSLEWADRLDRRLQAPGPIRISPPKLPMPAQTLLNESRPATHSSLTPPRSIDSVYTDAKSTNSDSNKSVDVRPLEPKGEAVMQAKYSGRALAEWMLVVLECGSFFDRRKAEGVPGNRWVETPSLGVESFKKPG